MGQRQARYCRQPTDKRHILVAHRVNDARDGPRLMKLGAEGIEIDVRFNGHEWVVAHSRFTSGALTIAQYMDQMAQWPQWPILVYLDIKTPAAGNLRDLVNPTVRRFPQTLFVFSTADGLDAKYLLTLPPECVLCVDFTNQSSAYERFHHEQRRVWLADGIAAGIINPLRVLRDPWPYPVEGRLAWTYSDPIYWADDVRDLKLDATIVEESLLSTAAAQVATVCSQ